MPIEELPAPLETTRLSLATNSCDSADERGGAVAECPSALLEALRSIIAALSCPAEASRILRTITEESAALLGAKAAFIAMPEASRGVLRVRVGVGAFASAEGESLPLEGSLEGVAFREGEALLIRDLASDARAYRVHGRQLPAGEALAIPLLSNGVAQAVLLLACLPDSAEEADGRWMLVRELAGLLGPVIENAAHFAAARSPDERLEQWREMIRLRNHLARYERAVELLRAVPFDWDRVAERFEWHDALSSVFGYDRAEFGSTLEQWLLRVLEADRGDVAYALRGESTLTSGLHLRFRLVDRDGTVRPVRIRMAIAGDGMPHRMHGVLSEDPRHAPGTASHSGMSGSTLLLDLQREIDDPLATIMAQARLLLADDLSRQTESTLRKALESVCRQGGRIDEAVCSRLHLLHRPCTTAGSALEGAARSPAAGDSGSVSEFGAIVEALPHGVLVVDPSMTLGYANPRMHSLLGREQAEMAGRHLSEVFTSAELARPLQDQLERALAGVPATLEAQLPERDGGAVWVQIVSRPLRAGDGRTIGILSAFTDVTARKQNEWRIREAALLDPLTQLPNRGVVAERIANAIARARRHPNHQFAVLFVDLDNLKLVNDSFGHSAGDDLLRAVTGRLRACMRPEDTVARVGGDEFAILLEGILNSADATRVAQRIQEELSGPIRIGGYEISASVSVGIALNSPTYESPEQVLKDADTAMYRAKNTGRGRFEIFDREMHSRVTSRLRSEAELGEAVKREELRLHYQPVVSLGTRRVVGIEALLRWAHPGRGLLHPEEFIALAETSSLAIPIGRWALTHAARQLHDWKHRFGQHAPQWVAVNLSSKQFLQPGLTSQVQQVLHGASLSPNELRLEVPESTISQDSGVIHGILADLRASGVRVTVDNFGTGLSSLSSLHALPIEAFKIDGSFVSDLRKGSDNRLVRTMVMIAEGVGAFTIAEGVNTVEQLGELRRLGCEYGQGHLFWQPLAADGIDELLGRERNAPLALGDDCPGG